VSSQLYAVRSNPSMVCREQQNNNYTPRDASRFRKKIENFPHLRRVASRIKTDSDITFLGL
jgi:hypothetical protein